MARVLLVLVSLWPSIIYGRYNGSDAMSPMLSELASVAEVDGSPCDIIFLPDDGGNQRTLGVLENASQVLSEIFPILVRVHSNKNKALLSYYV